MRLIDADSIRYRNAKLEFPNGRKTHGYFAVVTSVEIEEAPTIEAEPVRRGTWLYSSIENPAYRICDQCGSSYKVRKEETFNLCSSCGAKMDGGKIE